ncbi:N-acetylmuramoyl-L-alanine amidase [Tsukamurella tyrosinosolvens]|uniref:N-acetylmuramoyl-L-alanine amidase n=1 Tax=Tsukamurella tyrosinosolvens TaxID=57704 RepID=UPI001930FE3A|nr:N-acetylmuramoyl-L-alanine amidase [Tsukamurella tyrosinosolvens]
MSAYTRDAVAAAFIAEGRRSGVSERGIVICLATGLVESNLTVYANLADPDSLQEPHDAVGSDANSVGPLQQRAPWWGSSARERMDPVLSSRLFYAALKALDYDSPAHTAGWYAQQVQRSAFPDRYDERMAQAQDIYDRLTAAAPSPSPDVANGTAMSPAPAYTEIDRMGDSRSSRNGAVIRNFLLHTEEGNSTAERLAAYCNDSAHGASYHYTVRDGVVCDVVDTDFASWSVLSANPYTISLCFAGSHAGWSRADWLERRDDLTIAAWLAVADARKYGFATTVIAPPYRVTDGISDHRYVTRALGIGSHTDVGDGFPWDVFAADVAAFTGAGAPAVVGQPDGAAAAPPASPPVDTAARAEAAITAAAARAADWIGRRKDLVAVACPDGRGWFAAFQGGTVYWTALTGAHTVPARLLESYTGYQRENGPLGYPVVDHTELPDGQVEAFERGVLYRRRDAAQGFFVTGTIGARWARDGYEKGPLGWPISSEMKLSDGGVRQDFEHGRLYWSPDGTTVVGTTAAETAGAVGAAGAAPAA